MNFKNFSTQTKQLFQNSKHRWLKSRAAPPKVYCQSSGVISSSFPLGQNERIQIEAAIRKTIELYMDVVFPAGPGRYHIEFMNTGENSGGLSCKLELSFKHQKWLGRGSGDRVMEALDEALEHCSRLRGFQKPQSDDDQAA